MKHCIVFLLGFSVFPAFAGPIKIKPANFYLRCNRPLSADLNQYVESEESVTFKWQYPSPRLYWLRVERDGRISGNASEEDTGTVDLDVDVIGHSETVSLPIRISVFCHE